MCLHNWRILVVLLAAISPGRSANARMHLLRGFVYLPIFCSVVYAASADSVTFFSSHPSIEYRPMIDCLQYTVHGCYKWGYAWQGDTYRNSQMGLSQSVAFTTDEHNVEIGKELRQISLVIPRGTDLVTAVMGLR